MELSNIIKERRAYRALLPFEVNEELIKELAELATLAPSCFNKQPWRFVFIHGEALNNIFEALSEGNAWAKKASLIIAVFSKPDLDCIVKERKYYLFDTGMATANIILLLTEMGLVAHPIAGFNEEKAKEVLKIPKEYTLITLIIVGKHDENYSATLPEQMAEAERNRPPRMKFQEFAFINEYKA